MKPESSIIVFLRNFFNHLIGRAEDDLSESLITVIRYTVDDDPIKVPDAILSRELSSLEFLTAEDLSSEEYLSLVSRIRNTGIKELFFSIGEDDMTEYDNNFKKVQNEKN